MSEVRSPWRLLLAAAATAALVSVVLGRMSVAEGQSRKTDHDARHVPFSMAVAVVVDTSETMSSGRIKVRFPWLKGGADQKTIEARLHLPVGLHADEAVLFLPEVDDEVLVSFAQGELRRPVVLGALWNGMDEPPR